ncbi:hypothetical protein [Chroococcidiopsis sp. CCMEE 29]|nr:hypothetical protein [Chroococcidiopsis sp. CCMEE 29]
MLTKAKLQDGFFSLGFSVYESRILPLAILLPIKLIAYIPEAALLAGSPT